ncbi:uncharacterized protein N7515_000642 [Penicillium bovifimosum]|uniref:Calcineurin-like phosphoesterase domain-containing protein n=1 Tax=Penicillium bovifimosum TaxID=126998 RepID=A0A9W9LBR3_9EURO|nr:uncharacterized protein N7515_000642 [Penicillium bovifimosum]KAJ5146078.1 hypothetical protein N7515_000642 [Penicillium bovifimosum]
MNTAREGWKSDPRGDAQQASNSPTDNTESPRWLQTAYSAASAPRFRRYALIYLALLILAWIGWRLLLHPPRLQERTSSELDDLIRIRTLDPQFVPSDLANLDADTKSQSQKRLIIVGDVHGCRDELVRLLEKVAFKQANDHLIFVGDMISKGPDSKGVVDLARQCSASSVRGNHEDRILRLRRMAKTGTLATPSGKDSSKERAERALASSLSDEQVQWLEACPVILDIGQVPGMGRVVVVHAGLDPGVELEEQDLLSVMTMRTLDPDTNLPSPKKKGVKWAEVFDKQQSALYSSLESSAEDPRSKTVTVVYGHDASSSLSIRTFTKGLDSGCVNGGELTALVIGDGGKQSIVQVSCRDYRKS